VKSDDGAKFLDDRKEISRGSSDQKKVGGKKKKGHSVNTTSPALKPV